MVQNQPCAGNCWSKTSPAPGIAGLFLMELLGHFPEAAPDGENHLLYKSAVVQTIQYEPNKVTYTTDGSSSDVLKLAFRPNKITVNGKPLPSGNGGKKGWEFDAQTRVLRLVHNAGKVVIH
jgi:hypothetical protein